MLKKPHLVALGAVSLLVVLLFSLPERFTAHLKLALSSFFLPIFGLGEAGQAVARKAGNQVIPRRDLLRELERLREENERLKVRLTQTEDVRGENNRLRELAGFRARIEWNLKAGRVIARDPANWWRTVYINLGTKDGVAEDMPVLTPRGLVGKVARVSQLRAQVLLLGDPNCQVAAVVRETGETGIITSLAQDPAIVTLTYLSKNANVAAGQAVTTGGLQLKPGHSVLSSGLGDVFPRGIPIGQVLDVRTAAQGLYLEARVRLAAVTSQLDEVWVVTR